MPLESPPPDPREATSPVEFVVQLRRLKAWSDSTYRRLEKEAMRRGHVLPHSTIATALKRESLPRTELVEALVGACGCDEETVARWVAVRQRLSTGPGPEATRAEPAPEPVPPARGADTRRLHRLLRLAPLAVVLLAAFLVISASSRPPDVRRPERRPAFLPQAAAWWRFEETGGTAAYDSSGHGATASIAGGAVRTAVPGGRALAFDGGGHVVARGPVVRTDEAFTVAAWVRLDETDDWGTVFSEHHGGRAPDIALLDYDAEHRDWAFMMPDRRKGWAMGDETVFSGLRPAPGRWTHLAAVHDPADRRVCLYVDGTREACRTRDSLTRADGPLEIGRAVLDGKPVDGWHGAIDDVRVFAHALSDAQIGEIVAHRA
ncbi:LamG domain-containing protein [Actinomadura sp. DC4]|uniref:LamG domain-containing protein n=1 Tax=Actinomadura sp. DC4 TaxID=3055069 RepID=UPI0025B1902A|nr:LamG domain-containing protein [Actinomadura sp. DC4]MDN3359744.1 LamG domain-containing protein [Actinomadura sp. DC4]